MIGVNEENVIDDFIKVVIEPENVGKVMELLTRIGILNKFKNELYQSVHLFKKAGEYYLPHFKEMYALNGGESTFDETDRRRRDKIAILLESYGLVKIVNSGVVGDVDGVHVDVISHKDKPNFKLMRKYNFSVRNSRYYKNPENVRK
jgi:hypothetical protein